MFQPTSSTASISGILILIKGLGFDRQNRCQRKSPLYAGPAAGPAEGRLLPIFFSVTRHIHIDRNTAMIPETALAHQKDHWKSLQKQALYFSPQPPSFLSPVQGLEFLDRPFSTNPFIGKVSIDTIGPFTTPDRIPCIDH